MNLKSILLLTILTLCMACSSFQKPDDESIWKSTQTISSEETSSATPLETLPKNKYEIRPGHILVLSCLQDSNLNGGYRVDFNGLVRLPYGKTLVVSGLTRKTAEAKIVALYQPLFQAGKLDLKLKTNTRKVYIETVGLVDKPGKLLIKPTASVDEILALAGGPRRQETPQFLKVTLNGQSQIINLQNFYSSGRLDFNYSWRGGESLAFLADLGTSGPHSASTLRILGEVQSPGQYAYTESANIYHYLAMAGGPTQFSDMEKVEIVRPDGAGRTIHKTLSFADFSNEVHMLPGDILIVHSNQPTAFERKPQIFSSLASIVGTLLIVMLAF